MHFDPAPKDGIASGVCAFDQILSRHGLCKPRLRFAKKRDVGNVMWAQCQSRK